MFNLFRGSYILEYFHDNVNRNAEYFPTVNKNAIWYRDRNLIAVSEYQIIKKEVIKVVDHSKMTFEQVSREYSRMSLEELQEEYSNVRKMGGYPKLYRELHKNMKKYGWGVNWFHRYPIDYAITASMFILIILSIVLLALACLLLAQRLKSML